MIDDYPKTSSDLERAVRIAGRNKSVLALLSVSSSGAIKDKLVVALGRLAEAGFIENWHVFVALDRRANIRTPKVTTWLPLPGQGPFAPNWYQEGHNCQLCRSADRSRVFAINPTTFHGMVPYQIRRMVPSINSARENRRFWEVCSTQKSISFNTQPEPAMIPVRRRDDRLGIRFDWNLTLGANELPDIVANRLASLEAVKVDLVLAPSHDLVRPGYQGFWRSLSASLGLPSSIDGFEIDGQWGDELLGKVVNAESILVFTLGVVTGLSVQRALTRIQTIRKDENFSLRCACIHARLADSRAWETLQNSFAHELRSAWVSPFPPTSPLDEEHQLIVGLDRGLLGDAGKDFYEERLLICSGDETNDKAIFWGSRSDVRLSPHSIFGESLDSRATLAAVGAAMQAARLRRPSLGVPEWPVFEMSAIVRSYFDALILAAVLRWLKPAEAWWGEDEVETKASVDQMLNRTSDLSQRAILVAELCLATAQGKVPASCAEIIRAHLAVPALKDQHRGAIELAELSLSAI